MFMRRTGRIRLTLLFPYSGVTVCLILSTNGLLTKETAVVTNVLVLSHNKTNIHML